MSNDTFALTQKQMEELLSKAWDMACFVYTDVDGNDARRFMENPHCQTLCTKGTEQALETPESLIQKYGEKGFDRVENSLLSLLKKKEPQFFGS